MTASCSVLVGGSAKAIEAGFFQEEIGKSAYAYQLAIESGAAVIVGLNKFADGKDTPVMPSPNYATLEAGQVASVKALKASRNADAVKSSLAELAVAAPKIGSKQGELMPLIIAAVRARATVGEISDALEAVWGHYRP